MLVEPARRPDIDVPAPRQAPQPPKPYIRDVTFTAGSEKGAERAPSILITMAAAPVTGSAPRPSVTPMTTMTTTMTVITMVVMVMPRP
jgi:hypothetical protein